MKILNLTEFRKLPTGTLFMNYEPCFFGDLHAKGETDEFDFLIEDITKEIDCMNCGDFVEKLEDAENNNASLVMDFDCPSRDGMFNKKQLFAVYEKRDVEMLIDKLNRCKDAAY